MMKSVYVKTLLLTVLALMPACRKEVEIPAPAPVPEVQTLHHKVTVQAGADTRATLDDNMKYIYEEGDRVYMESVDGNGAADGNMYGFLSLSVEGGIGKNVALFEGDLTCVGDFKPTNDTDVKLVLVGANDNLHTISDGKVTGTDYVNKWAGSLKDAVSKLSDFTDTGKFGDTGFTLAQQSSFLVVSLAFESKVGAGVDVNAKLYKNHESESSELLHEVSCLTTNVGGEIQASWVAAFPASTEVTGASLVVTATGVNVPPLKMANATLQANTYYSIQRDTYIKDYFAVEAKDANTVVTFNYATATNGIQYSLDGYQWNKYETPITLEAAGDKVYFRGKATSLNNSGNTVVSSNEAAYVYGDIMFLMCEGAYKPRTAIPNNNAFKKAFKDATWLSIKEGKELKLSANVLKESCYESMFEGCTSLTSGVSIPVIAELSTACFKYMFKGSGIITAPVISVTTSVGESSCQEMFNGCIALKTVPSLTVSSVGKKGCFQMFNGCTSLSSVTFTLGSLAAVASGNHEGCKEMFLGCTSLTSAEGITLTAPTLYAACYYSMFQGCTGLTLTPALPATSLAKECYRNMFNGCSAITTAPSLNATTLAEACYYSMFEGCGELASAPDLPASALVKNCYRLMFNGCSLLNSVRCMATTGINTDGSTTNWLQGVFDTGTFTQSLSSTWPRSASGIPTGWTCQKGFEPGFPGDPFDPEEDF